MSQFPSLKGKTMPCERCGSTMPTQTYKPNLGTIPGKTLEACAKCYSQDQKLVPIEGKEPMTPGTHTPEGPKEPSVPAISPATPPRNETEAFMVAGPTVPLAQSPEAADANITQFSGATPEPVPTTPAETVPAQAPVTTDDGSTPAVTAERVRADLKVYERNLVNTDTAIAQKKKELSELTVVRTATVGAIATCTRLLGKPVQ